MKKLVLLFALAFACLHGVFASTFTVINALNAGPGSLRAAMMLCNQTLGADTIAFNIAGPAPHTIAFTTALPLLTDAGTTIDGNSQPLNGSAATGRRIILDGGLLVTGSGITIAGANCTVMGLILRTFPENGILIMSSASNYRIGGVGVGNTLGNNGYNGLEIDGADGGVIQGNLIGMDDDGYADPNYQNGIHLVNGADSAMVGGTMAGEGNVVSGNLTHGMRLDGCSNATILGNIIGMDPTGFNPLGNDLSGILLNAGSDNNVIGSAATGGGNLISGNAMNGIVIDCSNGNTVKGNLLGTNILGTGDVWGAVGISIGTSFSSGTCPSTNNVIGGLAAGEGNVIAHTDVGLNIWGADAHNNSIRGNSFLCNISQPISLFDPMGLQPDGNDGYLAPTIIAASPNGASGIANPGDWVDLYMDHPCPQCEPYAYIATVQADSTGTWSYVGALSGTLGAIATNSTTGNSSANSGCYYISATTILWADFSASSQTLCTGAPCIDFTDMSTGQPTGWNWYFQGGNPSTSTAQNPQNICFNSPGQWTVTLTARNGTDSSTTVVTNYITVLPQPQVLAGPDFTICAGDTVQLQGFATSSQFVWAPSDSLSNAMVQTPMAFPASTTQYIFSAQGFCTDSDTMQVTVYPLPTASFSQQGFLLTASMGVAYQWYLNGTAIPTATSQSWVVQVSGTYHVAVTGSNGCAGNSQSDYIEVVGVGASAPTIDISVSPNPSADHCIVTLIGLHPGKVSLRVTNMLGIEMACQTQILRQSGPLEARIALDGFPCGIYHLAVQQGSRQATRLLVVER